MTKPEMTKNTFTPASHGKPMSPAPAAPPYGSCSTWCAVTAKAAAARRICSSRMRFRVGCPNATVGP